MRQTFTWFPNADHTKESKPLVNSSAFGDGYSQRMPDGINSLADVWSLTFTGTREEIDPIDDFLAEHKGCIAFNWRTPESKDGLYLCEEWTKRRESGTKVTLSCKFKRTFDN